MRIQRVKWVLLLHFFFKIKTVPGQWDRDASGTGSCRWVVPNVVLSLQLRSWTLVALLRVCTLPPYKQNLFSDLQRDKFLSRAELTCSGFPLHQNSRGQSSQSQEAFQVSVDSGSKGHFIQGF